jgi:hypothetical protein
LFRKKYLWTEKSDLESGKLIPVAIERGDASGVVQDLVAKLSLLMSYELSGDSIHSERGLEISQRPWDEVRETGTDTFGAS